MRAPVCLYSLLACVGHLHPAGLIARIFASPRRQGNAGNGAGSTKVRRACPKCSATVIGAEALLLFASSIPLSHATRTACWVMSALTSWKLLQAGCHGPHCYMPAATTAVQKNFDSKQQTLRAVTIKQLYDASNNRVDDSLVIDGKEITNVGLLPLTDASGAGRVQCWLGQCC